MRFLLALTILAVASGCNRRCQSNDSYYNGWVDTGRYWVDTGGWVDTGRARRDTGGYWNSYEGSVEIGVGARDFINVPFGEQVSPSRDSEGNSYFDIALRMYGLERKNLTIDLAAYVGEEVFASNRYENIKMQCKRFGEREIGSLRLDLDPAVLPPLPAPVLDTGRAWRDTGWNERDTGFYWVDTGFAARDARADVRIEAKIVDQNGTEATGEANWFIYR